MRLRYRFHRQTAADFYEDIYDTNDPVMEPYITDDQKLSELQTQTVGLKLSLGLGLFGARDRWERAVVDANIEYVVQSTSFGNAAVAQLGLTVPFDY